MKEKYQIDRRKLLKRGALLGAFAIGGNVLGNGQSRGEPENKVEEPSKPESTYSRRSRHVTSGLDQNGFTPLQDSEGIITPNGLHYVFSRDPSLYTPPNEIDPREHRLLIHGMVERPKIYSLDDLRRLPSVSRINFLECVSNTIPSPGGRWKKYETVQERHGKMSCALWSGVALSTLLRETGVKKGAAWILAESVDGVRHAMNITLEKAMDDAMVALGKNGEPLYPANGFPMRLFVPGFEGVRNVKWLRRLEVTHEPYPTKVEVGINANLRMDGKQHWFNMEMGPKSVITFPASGGRPLTGPGYYEITGIAWSGAGKVRRVEVSVDGGRKWQDTSIDEPILRRAWARFRLTWKWDGDETVIQSRCTDDQGVVQPSLAEFAGLWGVKPDYFTKTDNTVVHFNPIQPWRISREGIGRNAIWENV